MTKKFFVLATLRFLTIVIMMMTAYIVNAQMSLLPGFPLETNSGVVGSMHCTKSSDESYAVCGSLSDIAVKYNLQPFSFSAKGLYGGFYPVSCDLYETSFQSTSRVVCAQQSPPTILFLHVSNMTQSAFVDLPNAYFVVVDSPNQVAYISNNKISATIYKIVNIASSSPSFAGNITWGQNNGDQYPCALLIIGDFLYVHIHMSPARLARIRISNFSHEKTVTFNTIEDAGQYDNLANDFNFIYDLTGSGILVRCTYQNNNFARFDSLGTSFSFTYSLAISPDFQTLLFTAWNQNSVVLVDVATFNQTQSTEVIIPAAFGRPIVMSTGIFYAFSGVIDRVYGFRYCPTNATYGGSAKIPCPAGNFCPDSNATSPTPCGPGKFTPSEGWCYAQTCPAGSFCPSDTTVSPKNCSAGSYCPEGSSLPIPCPAGSYCPSNNAPPSPCEAGYYCPENSTNPIACAPGTSSSDPTNPCSICPVNFYCPSPSTWSPLPCPAGTVCPAGSIVWLSSFAPLPNSPIDTSSGVVGSLQCTKNSDESYAVCGSTPTQDVTSSTSAVKYNLQPFAFAATGPKIPFSHMMSCDLYETPLQPTSSIVVCALQPTTVFFLRVSSMAQVATLTVPAAYFVLVNTPNQAAYVSVGWNGIPATIYKITNIASSSPSVAGNVTWGQNSGDESPCALLIIGDFLYAHLWMFPARLARIRISDFSHDATIPFLSGESYGRYDNLANDFNFIYDLTRYGVLVRCTYQNNKFARFDHLKTGFTSTFSFSISPDLKTLFFTAQDQNAVVLVNVTAFTQVAVTAPIIPSAFGRPIVMSNGIFYAFSVYSAPVYGFSNCYRQANSTYGGPSKIICPAGYFCPDPNATSPTPCGPGRFSPSEGWCSCSVCTEQFFCPSNTTVNPEPCPAGFYCPNTTSSIPSPCGSFCPSGSSEPSLCNAGTFNPNIGSVSNKSCEMCPLGQHCHAGSCFTAGCSCGMYCSAAGQANCTPGYYNTDPSFFCSLCPEGSYCPSATTCTPIPCGKDQFCPPGSSAPSLSIATQLPNSPIESSAGSFQCTKNSGETYAVCGSLPTNQPTGCAIKYNLRPFFVAASASSERSAMMSCDLFDDASSESSSRAVCSKPGQSVVIFLRVSDMVTITNVSVSNAYFVVVDSANRVAYVSNPDPAAIFKIINIASPSPSVAAYAPCHNGGDNSPCALLIVGDFLYAHLDMNPARLARFRISNFSYDDTVAFVAGEYNGQYDNLANDNNFIYDLIEGGILVRCTYQNNNFARFDSLSTSFTSTYSLSISPDFQTLFFTAWDQNAVVLVEVATFRQVSATPSDIPSSNGRPIVMSNGIFYAFSSRKNQVYAFKYCMSLHSTCGGPSKNICPVGHFCPDPNATAPTPCSSGTYATGEGFCLCPYCPAGAFCASTWKTPQNCPAGTYNAHFGASSIAACVPCPLGKICQEGSITPLDCNQQNCDSTRNCTLYSKVLVGVTNAQPYCVVSNRSSCTSPLTCSSINLPAYDIPLQCEAAGCSYSGSSCVNRNDCFNLFLPSFVIQPLGLMFIGFAKDVVVLLLIGIFGDVFMRRVKTLMLPFKFWKNKWNKAKIKVSMETTIFANDANCRNESSTKQESFEGYCEKIADALFELPETADEEIRKDWKRKLVDAITFSMFDFGLWLELEEIEEPNNDNNEREVIIQKSEEVNEQQEADSESNEQTETSNQALSAKDEESEPRKDENDDVDTEKDDSNEAVNDENLAEEKNKDEIQDDKIQNEEPRLQQNQENVTSATLKCDEEETTIQESQPANRKLILTSDSFTTTSTLQQFVNAHIFSNSQRVVYFASSRDWKVRAASALNNFPSTIQLFYYITSVIVFVAFTFRDVVLDSYNQNIIGQVSNFTCGNAEKHSQSKTTYLLLGFRFLNSSSTATVILIFIKTLHAIYSSSSERFEKLQLPQRLPILGLLTSKSTQILLIFYFLVVASFALAGVTYGLHIIPSLVVVVIAAVLLILDSAILKLLRAFISKRKARQDAHRDKVLEQVATQELPFLGLNDRTEYDTNRESLLSHSQRSLSTINDDQQKDRGDFDFITADEAFEAAKQSVLKNTPTVSLPQALLVFLLKEEIPTIILTITLQLCFNYICLLEFGEAFGVADQWRIPNTEYEARKFNCIWGMFESDVSSKISVLTSFVGFL